MDKKKPKNKGKTPESNPKGKGGKRITNKKHPEIAYMIWQVCNYWQLSREDQQRRHTCRQRQTIHPASCRPSSHTQLPLPPNPPSVSAEFTNRYTDLTPKNTHNLWSLDTGRSPARSRVWWDIATKVCVKSGVNPQRERNLGQFPLGRATADDNDGPEGSGVHFSLSFKTSFVYHKCPVPTSRSRHLVMLKGRIGLSSNHT